MLKYPTNPNYSVTTDGEVYSHLTDIFLKPGIDSKGYPIVVLCNNGKTKTTRIHRMVAETYIPNPENKPQVNHKDGNRANNHLDNLEWVTYKENADHYLETMGYKYLIKRGDPPANTYVTRPDWQPKQGEDHFNFKGHYEYNNQLYPSLSSLAKAMGLIKQTAYNRVKAGLVKFIPKPPIV